MSTCTKWIDKVVIECKQTADRLTRQCHDWAEQRRQRCDRQEDQGYNRCDRYEERQEKRCQDWDDRCCDWWPCSWACDVITWVCVAWAWVTTRICVAWVWVSHLVCVAWSYVVEYVCVAWFWIIEHVCIVWSWFVKVFCIAWDTLRCALVNMLRGLLTLIRGRRRSANQIKYVFVLMLENRSFDHMLGFSAIRGTDAQTGAATQINNLIGNPQSNIDPGTGLPVNATQPADFALSTADKDPGHEFHNTLEQLAGSGAVYPTGGTPSYPPINNSGFVANYRGKGSAAPEKCMHVYSPEQLPILNTLAQEFAVCDNWFSSMPGPTWPNRLFVHASSSAGLDDSPSDFDTVTTTLLDGYRFDNGSIYDRLEDKCLNWLVFEGDETPQVFALSGMNFNALQGRFRDMEDFRDSVNDRNFPASYSFIEPNYGNILPWTPADFTCGTSQHPLDDVTRGEQLIKDVYEAVRNSPHWKQSMIIINYDEHGGFFDHVAPPAAVPPGDSITDDENNHNNFDFSQLGVRVPAVIISPLIPRNTIDHQSYDHSSVVKTVAEIFNFKTLTNRDAQANSFRHLLSLTTARDDAPTTLPPVAESGWRCTNDDVDAAVGSGASGLINADVAEENSARFARVREEFKQREIEPGIGSFMQIALRRYISLVSGSEREVIIERYKKIKNSYDARLFITEARNFIKAYKLINPPRKPWKTSAPNNKEDKVEPLE